jgi:hypothetical protein
MSRSTRHAESEVLSRLDRLYGALETDQLSLEDVAPRIKELRLQLLELESWKEREAVSNEAIRLTREEITRCALDLQTIMASGSIRERKSFLRSFIRKVTIPHQGNNDGGEIEYTLPLPEHVHDSERNISREVLSAVQCGSPPSIKTYETFKPRKSAKTAPCASTKVSSATLSKGPEQRDLPASAEPCRLL